MAVSLRSRIIVATVVVVAAAAVAYLLYSRRLASPTSSSTNHGSDEEVVTPPQLYDFRLDQKRHFGFPLRPMDTAVFEVLARGRLKREQLKDLFPDRGYQVRLIYSVPDRRVTMVAIDLDRNGKFDERWELGTGTVKRQMLGADRPSSALFFTLNGGRWIPR